jgi:hypothetical protein
VYVIDTAPPPPALLCRANKFRSVPARGIRMR